MADIKNKVIRNHDNSKQFTFLVKKENGAYLGYAYADYISEFDHYEIGVTLVPSARNKGVGQTAHKLLATMMFSHFKARRLQALVSTQNVAEIKVLTKCGFKLEGIMSKAGFLNGNWHDIAIYSVFP